MFWKKTPRNKEIPEGIRKEAAGDTGELPQFFDCFPVATVIIEEDGTISRANARFCEMCGFTAADIEGVKNWREFINPDDYERLASYHREILRPGGLAPSVSSFVFTGRDRAALPCHLRAGKIPGSTRTVVSITDATIQKKLEGLLRSNEERYRQMVNHVSVGLFKTRPDPPGKCLWANPALIGMYGCVSLADFARVPVLSYYADPADRDRFLTILATEGEVQNFEVLHKKKDGTPFWIRLTAFPKYSPDGSIEWIEGTIEDINACRVAISSCEEKAGFLTDMVDSALGTGLICTDLSGTITLFNRGAEILLGYTADDVVGKTTPLIFCSESELAARSETLSEEAGRVITDFEILTYLLASAPCHEQEWTWEKKDGAAISVHVTISRIRSKGGNERGYLISAKEITDQKQLEEVFRSSALQMSGVIYNLPDATFAIDAEGKVIAWNRAMEDTTGISATDILGKGNFEYALPFYGERRPLLIDLLDEPDERIRGWGFSAIRRKGNAVTAETPTIDPSNTLRILWGLAAPIFDAEGNRIGAIESIADVTERRKRETALEDNVVKFRKILDNTGAATAIIEEDDTISYINPEFGRTLGYVREEIERKKKWTEFVVPEDVRTMEGVWKRADLDDSPVRHELRFIRWDGEVRNGYLTITRIPDTHKIVVALLDVTDKVRAESALQEANRKLNFLNSITRHDILNHLTVLKGNLELSIEEATEPRQKEVLKKELAAADAIQSLITITRDYQDLGISPPEWQDLRWVILKSIEGIRFEDITLLVDIEGVEVFADLQLRRVFSDLFRNATSYGKTTRIRIFCQESFEELHIVFEDDGIGIPPEEKERIFTRECLLKGGFDLFLAKEILSITGIGIRETGVHGKGAEFELRVPKGGYRFTASQG